MSQNKRPIQSTLELPAVEGAKKKIEISVLQWEAQLSEELSKAPDDQRRETISRLQIRLEIAQALLKMGRCHVHKLRSIKTAADHVVANAISCIRLMLKPYLAPA